MVSGEMIILPEIPFGRRTTRWSQRTNVVERVLTFRHACGTLSRRRKPEQESTHDAQHIWCMNSSIMQGMAWQFTSSKHYTLSEARYATSCISMKLHVELFSSLPFRYTAILNVVKHGTRVKHKLIYLSRHFKWGRKWHMEPPRWPHMLIYNSVQIWTNAFYIC